MYIDQLNLLFIHCPKTGGNTISTIFLPYSADKKVMGKYSDGIDRFGIKGDYTKQKHDTLASYYKYETLKKAKIFTALRHPVERLISWYFSPHRWLKLSKVSSNTSPTFKIRQADFNIEEFKWLVNEEFQPQSHWLTVDNNLIKPDYIIDFSNFSSSLAAVCSSLSIDYDPTLIVNKSRASSKLKDDLSNSQTIKNIVKQSPHAVDWENFQEMNWD